VGIFGHWGRSEDKSGATADPVVLPGGAAADEQAVARYRYMLRTAPPEAIEQAHAEAFGRLTPEQRSKVLERVAAELPQAERDAVRREGSSAGSLARAATRAEIHRPGTLERMFGGMGTAAGPSLGGLMAGTMLSSMAGMVLGSAIAHHFFQDDAAGHAAASASGTAHDSDAWGDATPAADEAGSDFGVDDGGSFDI
jgi:hypothetical protein